MRLRTGDSPLLSPAREAELLDLHRAGDAEALGILLRSYQRRMYSICHRMLRNPEAAKDVAQDAIIRIIEGLDSFDSRSRLSTWVIRVTINCCLSHLRREKLRSHASLDAPRAGLGDGEEAAGSPTYAGQLEDEREPSGSRRIEQHEQLAMLNRAFDSLSPDVRLLLVLRDLQNLEYQQIAEVIETPVGTVKSRLFRAREALRNAIEVETSRHRVATEDDAGHATRKPPD